MYNPELLARNFSRAHHSYNQQATVQQQLAFQVVEQILVELVNRGIQSQTATTFRVVDLGAGTNLNLLLLLLEKIQQATKLTLSKQQQFWQNLVEKSLIQRKTKREELLSSTLVNTSETSSLASLCLKSFSRWHWQINIVDLASIPTESLQRLEQLAAELGWQLEIKVFTQSLESWLTEQLANSESALGFDLIISNACLQWLTDLPLALQQIKDLLTEQGKFIASLFIAGTLQELSLLGYPSLAYWQAEALAQLLLDLGYASLLDWEAILAEYSNEEQPALSQTDNTLLCWQQKLYFANVLEIMRHFKLTGVNNLVASASLDSASPSTSRFWTRKQLQQLEQAYQQFAEASGLPVSYVAGLWALEKATEF